MTKLQIIHLYERHQEYMKGNSFHGMWQCVSEVKSIFNWGIGKTKSQRVICISLVQLEWLML